MACPGRCNVEIQNPSSKTFRISVAGTKPRVFNQTNFQLPQAFPRATTCIKLSETQCEYQASSRKVLGISAYNLLQTCRAFGSYCAGEEPRKNDRISIAGATMVARDVYQQKRLLLCTHCTIGMEILFSSPRLTRDTLITATHGLISGRRNARAVNRTNTPG